MKELAKEGVISYIWHTNAGIAQLVERNLAKVDVAGSNPVSRSAPIRRGTGAFGNRTERSLSKYTSSLKWPRRPQSHQVAGFYFAKGALGLARGNRSVLEEDLLATYPSGKGEVCKTFMHRFESDRRLKVSWSHDDHTS